MVGVLFLLLSLAAALAVHYYYTRSSYKTFTYPIITHTFIIASNFVCIMPFPLLVLDVDAGQSALVAGMKENPESRWIAPWWLAIFVITQLMAWIILPILQEIDTAGEFTVGGKFVRALKENVKMYIVMGIVAGGLFGYIVFLKGVYTFIGLFNLTLAAVNAFGLTLIVIFLSVGLVGIPKMLWRSADPKLQLRMHYFHAPDLQEEFDIAKLELSEVRADLMSMEPRATEEAKPRLNRMLEDISSAERNVTMGELRVHQPSSDAAGEITVKKLEYLNMKLKRSVKITTRLHYLWTNLVKDCVHLDGATGPYWTLFRKPLLRIAAVFCFIFSWLILWCELAVPLSSLFKKDLSPIEVLMRNPGSRFLTSVCFLFYMGCCSYWAAFQFKVFDIYLIVPGVSDAASLCFTGTFLTRLIMPTCYNFLWISDLTGKEDLVTYGALFGKMDVVDFLGDWFNRFIPIFIPIMALLIQIRFFDKVLEMLGVVRFDPTDMGKMVGERINDGRKLVMVTCGRELSLPLAESTPNSATSDTQLKPAFPGQDSPSATPPPAKPERGKRYAEYKARKALEEGTAS